MHRAFVNDDFGGDAEQYRWECTCRRDGRWTPSKEAAERGGKLHETRYAPKPKGPKALRRLLTLG